MRRVRIALPIVCVSMLSACAATPPGRGANASAASLATSGVLHLTEAPANRQEVTKRSYTAGQLETVSMGQPVVSLRSYTAVERVASATALHPLRAHCVETGFWGGAPSTRACSKPPLDHLRFKQGQSLEVAGSAIDASDETHPYVAVALPTESGVFYVLADRQGRLKPGRNVAWSPAAGLGAYDPDGRVLAYADLDVPLEFDGRLFDFATVQTTEAGPSALNYDLVYDGRRYGPRGLALALRYREYGPTGDEQLLYTQEFFYDRDVGDIDFKDLIIHISQFDDDAVTFSVEEHEPEGSRGG